MREEAHKAVYEASTEQLDRELASGDALGSRAVALLGFSGVILALAAGLATNGLGQDLGTIGRPLAVAALIGSFAAVLAAAGLSVSILTPRQRGRIKPAVLRELRREADSAGEVYERLSKSTIRLYREQGGSNDFRGLRLRSAYLALAVGLCLVAVQAGVFALSSTSQSCLTQKKIMSIRQLPSRTTTKRVLTTSSTVCVRRTRMEPSRSSRNSKDAPRQ